MSNRIAALDIIKKVLDGDYLSLEVWEYSLVEAIRAREPCRVVVHLARAGAHQPEVIEGRGVGFIDAAYHALMDHFAREYPSLRTIHFTGFEVKGQMDTTVESGTDMVGVVTLPVTNSQGSTYVFEQSGRSIVAAGLAAVVEAVELFVNSERAFINVYRALCDARERGRSDLVQSFTSQLASLVNTTSYSEVIERIKQEERL